MSDSGITPKILKTIDILEDLETLVDKAPTPEVDAILQEAWIKVSETFPEDFKEATLLKTKEKGKRKKEKVRII